MVIHYTYGLLILLQIIDNYVGYHFKYHVVFYPLPKSFVCVYCILGCCFVAG